MLLSFPGSGVRTLGIWLYPATSHKRRSAAELNLQFRAGVVGTVCIFTGAIAIGLGFWNVTYPQLSNSNVENLLDLPKVAAAIALVSISVFAPQVIFRTRNASHTREILLNPSTPLPPWNATTITFQAVLVGGMLSGLYFASWMTFNLFAIALVSKMAFRARLQLERDPNARFHLLIESWISGVIALSAFVIVYPLAAQVSLNGSILPLILAGFVAMFLDLTFSSAQRWVTDNHTRWAFAHDAVDPRRIAVALVSTGLAWLVVSADTFIKSTVGETALFVVSFAGLGAFVSGWLTLWCASIWIWRRDGMRTLAMWNHHQTQIVLRLADGSLSPELARRATLPTVARMAISVFGATRAMSSLQDERGAKSTYFVSANRYDNAPPSESNSLGIHPYLHLRCSPNPDQTPAAGVTIGSWLSPGWFMTRSPGIVSVFTNLATSTLFTPVIAETDASAEKSFSSMFDPIHRWPTLEAFNQAVEKMRIRVDANPHSDSLIVAVFAIDDFGALSGGRFEHAAAAQVVRLTLGEENFVGRDLFVAYESPGRIWIALAGGPIIRSGIASLSGLQTRINDHGSVPSSRLDLDIHVSVSFGYAAHQVDDFNRAGLMTTAIHRLNIDANSRSPYLIDSLLTYDLRPEDIIGEPDLPLTTVDVLSQLRESDSSNDFALELSPIIDTSSSSVVALICSIGWNRTIGNVDLSKPSEFGLLINGQRELAAAATNVIVQRLIRLVNEIDATNFSNIPLLVKLPDTLLHPDAGQFALPNLLTPALKRIHAVRTVVLFDAIPSGAGQALRLLEDRGINIALTAGAAAGADPAELQGWSRWGIVFPQTMLQGDHGIDSLTIQQTLTAIAGQRTWLIGQVDHRAETRGLAQHKILFTTDPNNVCANVDEVLESLASADQVPQKS